MLSKVKKTPGGVDRISLEFGIIMTSSLRQPTLPVKTRGAEMRITQKCCDQMVFQKIKVISNNFRLIISGKVLSIILKHIDILNIFQYYQT